ncbi:site-2 protease family protein, partial [bacterium]|nr:site-2 protease family protein [bacterium]
MGLEKIKDTQIELNEIQKELREKVYGKNYYISDGKTTLNDIAYALSDNIHPLIVTVERNGELIDLKTIYPNKDGIIGFEKNYKEIMIPTKNFKSIIKGSNQYLFNNTYMLLYGLKQIFTGKVPINDLHGVILITKIGGDKIANEGIFSGILLAALISLDLAIVNFLPIPALDGGHVLFLLIEKLRGRKLDEDTINKIGNAGFMFLIILMIYVIFNDIWALITHKF